MFPLSAIKPNFGSIYQSQASIKKMQADLMESNSQKQLEQLAKDLKQKGINLPKREIDRQSIEQHIEGQKEEINAAYNLTLGKSLGLSTEAVDTFNQNNPEYASVYFHKTKDGKIDINAEREIYTLTQEDMEALKTFMQARLAQQKPKV